MTNSRIDRRSGFTEKAWRGKELERGVRAWSPEVVEYMQTISGGSRQFSYHAEVAISTKISYLPTSYGSNFSSLFLLFLSSPTL